MALVQIARAASSVSGRVWSGGIQADKTTRVHRGQTQGRRNCGRMSTQAIQKEVVSTDKAPAALGPYSQAIKAGNLLYISGQIGIAPGSKEFVSEGVEGQTEQVLKNIGGILEAAGVSYKDVVKTTVLLEDMGDFAKMNGVYAKFFPEEPPARAAFAVKTLPLNAKVEIEAVALVP